MMLDNAREHGVDAQEGVRVLEVLFDGDRAVGVKIRDQQNNDREVFAKVVVDASGQTAMLQNRFKLRLWDPVLNKGAIWTYWENAYRDTGRDEGATLVIQTGDKQGWFWYIPQHDNIVSVGVVAPFSHLFNKERESHEKTYEEEVENAPGVKQRLANAKRVTGYFVTKDYSYRSREVAGRWLGARRRCVRVSRSAVFLGRAAGTQVGTTRRRRDCGRACKGRYLRRSNSARGATISTAASIGCGVWSANTTQASASASSCGQYPELRGTVTDLLIGDLFDDRVDKVWAPMESLYKSGKARIQDWTEGTPAEHGRRQGE